MAYDLELAERIREYLGTLHKIKVEEKKMFGGLAFLVNGKMCVCASGERLMCRFDPSLQDELEQQKGYLPMSMRGKELAGYCYVEPNGFKAKKDFDSWLKLCVDFNEHAKGSKPKKMHG